MGGWDEISRYLAAAGLLALAVGLVRPRLFVRLIPKTVRKLFRRTPRTRRFQRPSKLVRAKAVERTAGATAPFALTRFWVVDGDTVQDTATKTIYRLENIDCPETEDRAKCYRERKEGERAKFEAIRVLKDATAITVSPTGKIDPYGRSIATIDVDGADFGKLMIARGLARPWRGVREDWCGPNGGLARMAEACSAKLHCKTCGARAGVNPTKQAAAPQSAQTVVAFPTVYRKASVPNTADDPTPDAPNSSSD